MRFLKLFILLFSFLLTGAVNTCIAKDVSSSSDSVYGSYFSIALPTKKEIDELQKIAMSNGVDLNSRLHDLPEDDEGWGEIFRISMTFSKFDRISLVYGYYLFGATSYFCQYADLGKFSEFLNRQPAKVKQRVRDFLYYHAFSADPNVKKNNERLMREDMSLIFPQDYHFAEDDPLFESIPLK